MEYKEITMSDTLEIFGVEYTGVNGIKATDDNSNTKTYIRPQGTKSITANGTGIDVSSYATADVSVSAPSPTLQTITKTYTPSTSAVTDTITASSGYDGIEEVDITVSAVPTAVLNDTIIPTSPSFDFSVNNNTGKVTAEYSDYEIFDFVETAGYVDTSTKAYTAITQNGTYQLSTQSATAITPTESSQTAVAKGKFTTGEVTVNAIPSNYVGSGITQRSSSDVAGYDSGSDYVCEIPYGYYEYNVYKTIPYAESTVSATKGSVNNHSVSVTPSVTNSAGYISGGTHSGTAVSVSASELVSGSQTITTNDTYDVTNLASVVVNVSGGGSSSMTIGTKTATLSSSASSISFTGLSGNPLSFVVTSSADQSTGGTKAVAVVYDGTSFHGMDVTTQAEADTGFSKSYSSGTLTITATSATFEANEYKLVYAYGGSSSDIHTADVQVGSGATSITFSSLSGRPLYFSCVFKSNFSTSSGYQRVIDVVNDGTNTYGHAFDSSAKAQTSWSYTYSGGNLTISSQGTNNGGYFHQPGYYQLTYAVDPNAVQYETVSKTYRASTSAQSEKIEPSTGYDAMSEVNISIPAVSQTNLTAGNIKSGTTISISNGSTNLWSVTGTYTGGGGGTNMNAQSHQSTTRSTSTTATSLNSLTCSTTGTYTVTWTCTRSSTSGSWSSQLYVGGTASGSSQTTWSNHVQTVTLTNVSISANQTVAVYGVSRGSNYYIYAPQLTIIQTA